MSRLNFFFCIILVLAFQEVFSMGKIECSELNLNIYDALTMEAVENITIYRVIAIQNNLTLFGFIPLGEPDNIDYHVERYQSDKNGNIQILSWSRTIPPKAYLLNEAYYVNIDFKDDKKLSENAIGNILSLFLSEKLQTGELILRNNLYKGIKIQCEIGEISEEIKITFQENEFGKLFDRKVFTYPLSENKKYKTISRTNEIWKIFLGYNGEDRKNNTQTFITRN